MEETGSASGDIIEIVNNICTGIEKAVEDIERTGGRFQENISISEEVQNMLNTVGKSFTALMASEKLQHETYEFTH